MAFTITAASIQEIGAYGGVRLVLTGDFSDERDSDFRVHVGPNGDSADPVCYGGPGNRDLARPVSDTELWVYLPKLEPTTGTAYDVFVQLVGGGTDTLVEEITVYPPQHETGVFSLRRVLPSTWMLGPREIDRVPPVSTREGSLANAEALTLGIGGSDNEIGGLVQTRLTQVATLGAAILNVENTLGWPDSGKVRVGGVIYQYAGRTDQSLTGITHLFGGATQVGTYKYHAVQEAVTNITGATSSMELLRRSLLVNYAEGEDLNTIGRNLGVPRLLYVADDDTHRGIIKALAYNPRGTVYGLELALDALLGAGNYQIIEDPINYPCVVFIELGNSLITDGSTVGRWYLPRELDFLADNEQEVPLTGIPSANIEGVGRIILKPERTFLECRTDTNYPTDYEIIDYEEDPGTQVWNWAGSGNELDRVLPVGPLTEFYDMVPFYYEKFVRIEEGYSTFSFEMVCEFYYFNPPTFDDGRNWAMIINDGAYDYAVGVTRVTSSNKVEVGFINTNTGAFIGTSTVISVGPSPEDMVWYSILIRRNTPDGLIELLLDGQIISTATATSFYSQTTNKATWGSLLGGVYLDPRVKQVALSTDNSHEYQPQPGGSQLNVSGSNPQRLTNNTGDWSPASVALEKKIRVLQAGPTNPQGGDNRGRYFVEAVIDAANADLVGLSGVDAEITTSTRIILEDDVEAFRYPEDLGKEITLSGSSLGNNGTFTITKLLERGTLTDYADYDTPLDGEYTNICEVSGGPLVIESGLAWAIRPVFVQDLTWRPYSLSWMAEFDDPPFIAINNDSWVDGVFNPVVRITLREALTGQILPDADIENDQVTAGPPSTWDYYPIYLIDPAAFVRDYVRDLLAAGIHPEFILSK